MNLQSIPIFHFLVFVTSTLSSPDSSLGQELSVERLYLDALRTCETKLDNIAVLSRRSFTRLGAIPTSRTETAFSIQCDDSSAQKASQNYLYMKTAETMNADAFGYSELSPSTELFAKVGDRSFGGAGGGTFDGTGKTIFEVFELTNMMKDQKNALTIGNQTRKLNVNTVALPFLSISSLWTGAEFSAAHHQNRISRVEYETDEDDARCIVFSMHNRSCVKKYYLDRGCNFMPTKMELYLRPEKKSSLEKADSLGRMLYRTSAEWTNVDKRPTAEQAENPRSNDSDSKNGRWFPLRIVLEEFPSKSKLDYAIVEIDSQWEIVQDPTCLTAESVLQQVSPNPIKRIYSKLSNKLESHIDEMDKKKHRSR